MPSFFVPVLFTRLLSAITLAALCIPPAQAQESPAAGNRNLNVAPAAKRVALVIGNAAYGASPLKNPVNDARAIAIKLQKLGFDVVKRENLTTRQIGATLREFRSRLSPGAEAIFFYAGHGLQVKGANYLPTVDADITSEDDVPSQSLNVSQILDLMDEAKTRLNLVFLDACRNNPFTRRFRSAGGGLAKIEAPSGTKISFATRPGSVAADGEGSNGLYTEHLLKAMDESGMPIEQALKRVYSGVKAATKGAQEPWEEGTIEGEFYFRPIAGTHAVVKPVSPAVTVKLDDPETQFWNEVKTSGSRDYLDAYLKQYPKGKFVALAKIELRKLDELAKNQRAQAATAKREEAELRPGKVFSDCADCPEMVVIPAGSFEMGKINSHKDEAPVHSVRIGKSFAMGKTEVTQGQWKAVMGSNPSKFKQCGDTCPVEQVSWNDVQDFVRKLSLKTGKTYRLPSEGEWEYACRAGGRHEFCGGDNIDAVGWYAINAEDKMHAGASKQPNAWGLYDMSGSLWEWVEDCRNANYDGAPSDGSAWTSGNCGLRVLRGGSWNSSAEGSRAAYRGSVLRTGTSESDSGTGFRLVRMFP